MQTEKILYGCSYFFHKQVQQGRADTVEEHTHRLKSVYISLKLTFATEIIKKKWPILQ